MINLNNVQSYSENREAHLDILKSDPSDFFAIEDGQLYDFVVDGQGQYEVAPVQFRPYYWDEEMIGDVTGFDIDAFEAELNHIAPQLFVRCQAISPDENNCDFIKDNHDKLQEIWHEALNA